jgi:hypothetical protein
MYPRDGARFFIVNFKNGATQTVAPDSDEDIWSSAGITYDETYDQDGNEIVPQP